MDELDELRRVVLAGGVARLVDFPSEALRVIRVPECLSVALVLEEEFPWSSKDSAAEWYTRKSAGTITSFPSRCSRVDSLMEPAGPLPLMPK